jgi:hypothetical protein
MMKKVRESLLLSLRTAAVEAIIRPMGVGRGQSRHLANAMRE